MYSFRMRSSLNVRTRYIVALYIRDFYNNYTRMEICIRSTFFRREHYKYYTNISLILYQNKYLSLVHGCCNTRHERIMALRRAQMAERERGSRARGPARAVLSIRLKRLKPLGPPSLGAHQA